MKIRPKTMIDQETGRKRNYNGILTEDDLQIIKAEARAAAAANYSTNGSFADGFAGLLCIGALTVGLFQTFSMGPFDLARTTYNRIIGDGDSLKAELVDYTRQGIRDAYSMTDPMKVEVELASALEVKLINGETVVNPQSVSFTNLWKATEEYAPNLTEFYFTPKLK